MTLTVITSTLTDLVPPVAKSAEVYATSKSEIIASATARKVFAMLEKSPANVGVLVVDQTVDSMYVPPFQYDGGGIYSGGVAVLNMTNPLKIGDSTLPLGISLVHELGHAVQYLEDKAGFKAKFETVQSGSGSTKFNVLNAEGKALTKYIQNTRVAQLMIENDNVARHEAPVCDDLGYPFRKKYS